MDQQDLAKLFKYKPNPRRSGHKEPYHILKEDIYEMARRRKMRLDELMLAVYLRGKAKRYGNPFKLSNGTITHELAQSEWIIRKVRARLQTKGLIKYNVGTGKLWTEYHMLDTVMLPNKVMHSLSTRVRKTTPQG